MLRHVVDQVLPGLETLAWEGPEKGAATYSISLDKVVINQALIYILDCLKN